MRLRTTAAITIITAMAGLASGCGSDGSAQPPPLTVAIGTPTAGSDDRTPEAPRTDDLPAADDRTPYTPEDEARYTAAIAQNLQDPGSDPTDSPLESAHAECVAPVIVQVIGVDRFIDNGVAPEDMTAYSDAELEDLDLTREEGLRIYDGYVFCGIDMRAQLLDHLASRGLSPQARICLEQVVTEDRVRSFMAAIIIAPSDADDSHLTSDPTVAPLLNDIASCSRAYG